MRRDRAAAVRARVARRGRPVGRVGACIDRLFNELHDEPWGWVGFFESFDDQEVGSALLDTACRWTADRGAATCVGPASFTTSDECGLLVDGFEHPPLVQTPHNPPYYVDLFEAQGLRKARDLWAYHLEPTQGHVARLAPLADRVSRRMPGLVVRPIRKLDFNGEVARMKEIYNAS